MNNTNYFQINSYSDFKIILADTDFNTFNEMAKLNNDFCFINLSSDFAVNFVIEYEKIDYLLISNRINNLDKVIAKANKKKIKIFILGKDIEYPLNSNLIKDLLIKEFKKNNKDKRSSSFFNIFKNSFSFNPKNWHLGVISSNAKKEKSKKHSKNKSFKKSTPTSNNISVEESENPKKEENDGINLFLDTNNIIEANNKINNIPESEIFDSKTKSRANSIFNPEIKIKKHADSNFEQFNSLNKTSDIGYKIKTIKQKVIAVIKAKGGVGSTTISIFLANLFKDLKTLIIDLNFNEGGSDIGYYLDLPKTPNLMVFTEGFDRNAFLGSIYNISNNLDVIQSPSTFMQSKIIDLKDIYNLTDIARKKYDLIIFDLPNNINEFYLGVIDLADLLVMVSDCTNGSIGRLLNLNSKYIYSELEKILVINKFNSSNPLKISVENLKDYFNIENITTLGEMDILTSRSDFKTFEFNNYKGFKDLTNIAKEILTK
jgi:MinD-like ATPase involved in chromosome partitioning or flagellar assembly